MNRIKWKDYTAAVLVLLSAFILLWATEFTKAPGDTDQAAGRVQKVLNAKMAVLNGYITDALEGDRSQWMSLDDLPADMVIYRYLSDTLQSWDHTFTLLNDEVGPKLLIHNLTNPRNNLSSPFHDVRESASFLNIGQSWYLVKSVLDGNCRIIAGLEVMSSLDNRNPHGINPDFHLGDSFFITPLSTNGGSSVYADGEPQFKVMQETFRDSSVMYSYLVWIALVLFAAALLTLLSGHRTLRLFWVVVALLFAAMALMYVWGFKAQSSSILFSPSLYADGPVFYSLGAVLLINLFILSLVFCLYLVRTGIFRYLKDRSGFNGHLVALSVLTLLFIIGILVYLHTTFCSIARNSNIVLELYRLNELSLNTAIVYLSFISLLLCLPLLIQFLRPAAKTLFGWRYDAFSPFSRMLLAALAGVYFLLVSANIGFGKEEDKVEVWANRLSVGRDIALELQLRQVENSIANDFFIASLSLLPNAGATIANRLSDNYMNTISQDYDVSVILMDQNVTDPAIRSFITERARSGVKIHENSRFVYTTTVSGHPYYSGMFTYFNPRYGVSYMLVGVEPKMNKEYGGYAFLLDIAAPGTVVIPSRYSYAKYKDRNLVSFKGDYPYPTLMSGEIQQAVADGTSLMVLNGYQHFLNDVDENETVIISRKVENVLSYFVTGIFIALFAFLCFSLMAMSRRRFRMFEKSYFKNRITSILMVSLIVTLIAMAIVSVFFVYQRNDANKQKMMSDKVNSLQAMLASGFRFVNDYREVVPSDLTMLMDNAGNMAKADITLYSPLGKAFKSTAPDVFDRMLLSDRINEDAFEAIVYKHRRYFINKEMLGSKKYYALYAPLMNEKGDIVAILSSPYTDENYDFEMEAVMHSITVISVFLILLLLARFMAVTVVDKMLKPIVTIGRRMNRTSIDNLERITYDRDDEISTLVNAYNLMVDDLEKSTKQLAQAERDKAWSSMARQVAHEIKNPLTPMKLQLQRLIRLKSRNAPGWEDKFDEVANVVLDHIDILTDTANEFSTFAKLSTEQHSLIDVDALLKEEISMFDNKDNIEFSYFGIDGATVMGPKPQLTRVFVNLITNAVQALEIHQQEVLESEGEAPKGRIMVSLRNSSADGFYDIVFEDNGQGVTPENQSKLFTPNFTTKSGGTGLGLAICRSILDRCDAEIFYSKSFALEGACFTVRYPKA